MKKAVLLPSSRATDNGESADTKTKLTAKMVEIPKLRVRQIEIEIVGISPIIIHAWSAKAIAMMLDKQLGKPSSGRTKRDPLEDFKQACYYLPDKQGLAFTAASLKACLVTAANDVSLKQTETRRAIHVCGEFIKIIAPPLDEKRYTEWDIKLKKELKWYHDLGCSMRQDLVRLESGVADLRFRPMFPVWSAKALLEYNESMMTAGQVTNLANAAGYGAGLCENRPSAPTCKSGEFGRFKVKEG
jgi:hypothetical protein